MYLDRFFSETSVEPLVSFTLQTDIFGQISSAFHLSKIAKDSQSAYTVDNMSYNFQPFKQKIKDTEEWLKKEFATIRTGRATPAILDSVKVEAYGSDMPVNQVANVSIEDARTLRITPWDGSLGKAVERGITSANLGLSVVADDKGIRVIFPELTSERRGTLVKLAKQKLEEARIATRSEREKILKDIEGEERAGKISEDEKFRTKTELQKMVDEAGKVLDSFFDKKEREIAE